MNTVAAEPYEKTLDLGKIDYHGRGRRNCRVTVEVRLRPVRRAGVAPDVLELSIVGNIWNARETDILSGGQNLDSIRSYLGSGSLAAYGSEAAAKVDRIVDVWRRWHLNSMRAGCEYQRANWDVEAKLATVVGRQRGAGWVRPSEHPDGLLTKPCEECGYRYGTAWLVEELPAEIIEEVRSW